MARLTSSLALILMTVIVGSAPGVSGSTEIDSGSVVAHFPADAAGVLTPEQEELVFWAYGRFQAAGLTPPEVTFVFQQDTEACGWHRGLYHHTQRAVEICHLNPDTLIHELAHAWVEANLTEADKQAFMRHRGVEVWNDHSVPWEQRGTEHAAEVIAWGIEEHDRLITWVEDDGTTTRRLLTIPHSTPEELAAAYRMLTGLEPVPALDKAVAAGFGSFSPEAKRPR